MVSVFVRRSLTVTRKMLIGEGIYWMCHLIIVVELLRTSELTRLFNSFAEQSQGNPLH